MNIAIPEGLNPGKVRKMIECCFVEAEVQLDLCLGRKRLKALKVNPLANRQDAHNRGNEPQNGDWEEQRSAKRRSRPPKRRDEEIIIVSKKGQSYSDILKTFKKGLEPAGVDTQILALRKVRKDDLLIKLKGKNRAADELYRPIKDKIPDLKVHVKKERRAVIHISDLDGEDIEKGIQSILEVTNKDDITVTSLRPAYAGTQKVTVKLKMETAKRLTREKKIRIGWVLCR